MPKHITSDLDQIINVYRAKLSHVGALWSHLMHYGVPCDVSMMKTTNEMLGQLEAASMHLLEERVFVETAKYSVRNLKQMLDVSRQMVDAKSLHVRTEEQEIERERSLKYKEFQKIHMIQEEKAVIERSLVPARAKMSDLLDRLSKKCIKQKYLEEFSSCLMEELSKDLNDVKQQTEKARDGRREWDRLEESDMLEELRHLAIDNKEMQNLRSEIVQLKETVQNQNKWYEEELHTKLFYSSRNKEIQNKITNLQTLVKRMERSGHHADWGQSKDRSSATMNDFSTATMIDALPDIQAKDVEDFLTNQFGMRVLADYSMLRRLKDEIGILGLAYLVERIRFQDHLACNSKSQARRSFKDLEEKQIEMALEAIAKEYRTRDERGGHSSSSHQPSSLKQAEDQSENVDLSSTLGTPRNSISSARRRPDTNDGVVISASALSTPTGSGTADLIEGPNSNNSICSTGSLKSKSSLSRIKRMFKL